MEIHDSQPASSRRHRQVTVSMECDFLGGVLTFEDIKLTITKYAIKEGEKVKVHISPVATEEIPILGPTETCLSPVVYCGPPGTVFNQQCQLSFPHNIVDENCWEFKGLVKDKPEGIWREIKENDKDYRCNVSNGRCFIELQHFTGFTLAAKARGRNDVKAVHMKVLDDWHADLSKTYEIYVETWRRNRDRPKDPICMRYYTYPLTSNHMKVCIEDVADGWKVEPKQLPVDKGLVWKRYACAFNLKSMRKTVIRPKRKIWLHQNGVNLKPYVQIPHSRNFHGLPPQLPGGNVGERSSGSGYMQSGFPPQLPSGNVGERSTGSGYMQSASLSQFSAHQPSSVSTYTGLGLPPQLAGGNVGEQSSGSGYMQSGFPHQLLGAYARERSSRSGLEFGFPPQLPSGNVGERSSGSGYMQSGSLSQFPAHQPSSVSMYTGLENIGSGDGTGLSSSSTEIPSLVLEDPTERMKDQKERFRKFLLELSTKYDGLNYKWLRLLLYEQLPISVLRKGDINAMTLFNKLDEQGSISCTNIILLSEIANITHLVSAQSSITAYKKTIRCKKGRGLTDYRKTLFKALREVPDDELPKLIPSYKLDNFRHYFDDIWDLVFYLEQEKYLDVKRQDKWIDFANLLNKTAKGIMISNVSKVFEVQST